MHDIARHRTGEIAPEKALRRNSGSRPQASSAQRFVLFEKTGDESCAYGTSHMLDAIEPYQ
jgi:hypothetical protein